MASRRRFRPGRALLLLALVLLCALLLELNRFLPGAWPGGGGSAGSRPVPAGTAPDPHAVVPSTTAPTPPPVERRVRLEIRVPSTGGGGEPPSVPGAVATGDGSEGAFEFPRPRDGFEVRRGVARILHGTPRDPHPGPWRVAWPTAPVAAARPPSTGRDVRVVDDRGPVAGATVHAVVDGRESVLATDAEGRARLPRGASPVVRVCASAPNRVDACVLANVDVPEPLVLTLETTVPVRTAWAAGETGAPLDAATIRIVPAGGAPRILARDGGFRELDAALPASLVATGSVEVEVRGRPAIRVPLAGLAATTPIPPGRPITLRVLDAQGAPVGGADVGARWSATADAEPAEGARLAGATRTTADGTATVAVPTDRPSTIVVSVAGSGPATVRLDAGADAATRDVTLPPQARLAVRVVGPDRRPIAAARVVVVSRLAGEAVRTTATTDADGVARLSALPAGRLEVLAHAPGRAWGATTADAVGGVERTAELALVAGARLRLVVEDPDGVPLVGVAVRSVERPDAGGGAPAPTDPDRAPWTTDENGVLVVDDLPARTLDLYLHRAGFLDEVVADVRPGDATWFATLVPAASAPGK